MRRLIVFAAVILLLGACGSSSVDPDTSGPDLVGSTTEPPIETDADALALARATWAANRPDSYEFTYTMVCECDQGPWTVRVDPDDIVEVTHAQEGAVAAAPYESINDVLEDIGATLEEGRFPVSVVYDLDMGYPNRYIFNEPELPVDGGFIFEMNNFVADPGPGDPDERQDFTDALARWEAAGLTDYDYTFTRGCFCPVEYVGPYEASVRDGVVTAASFNGTDLLKIDVLAIGAYDEIVLTVDGVFAEIEKAMADADTITVEYHPELGHPTEVFIDLDVRTADEEVNYTIADVVDPEGSQTGSGGECSTDGVDITLTPRDDVPPGVKEKRQQIFDAAMACDIEAVGALTDSAGFTASFGGGDPAELWTDAEARGDGVLLDLVRHLNLAHSLPGEDGLYIWPSAFTDLQSPDGQGLSDEDFEELLTVYSQDELDAMFDGLGAYVGYRIGIEADGTWIFFAAGD